MDHVVGAELAWAVATAGHPTLRFNFRGVGASQGKPSGPKEQIEDAEAALRLAQENAAVAAVAVASLGGSALTLLELQARHPGVCGLCLISPRGLEPAYLARLKIPVLLVIGAAESQQPRVAYSAALAEIGGHLEIIDDADATFTRNLPQVGRTVARWLAGLDQGLHVLRKEK